MSGLNITNICIYKSLMMTCSIFLNYFLNYRIKKLLFPYKMLYLASFYAKILIV